MDVIASCAISLDGYMDDKSNTRLILSSEEDYAAIHSLRASVDGIAIGAETLRNDNPSLTARLENETLYPARIIFTRSGNIDMNCKALQNDPAQKIIFSTNCDIHDQKPDNSQNITTYTFNGDLQSALDILKYKHDISRLLVEGGSALLQGMAEIGAIQTLRLATAPITVGESMGRSPFDKVLRGLSQTGQSLTEVKAELFGDTKVVTYNVSDMAVNDEFMQEAINVSKACEQTQNRYAVGAVLVDKQGHIITTGYTGEDHELNHAEEVAFMKALKIGADLNGAKLYSSMEPCNNRASRELSCCDLIIKHGIQTVYYAYREPSHFVKGEGHEALDAKNIQAIEMPHMAEQVITLNVHILKKSNT
jgi:5-amino-6-(5-phosphoribosylamino)uracil reductase